MMKGITEPIIRNEYEVMNSEIAEQIINENTEQRDGFTGTTLHD